MGAFFFNLFSLNYCIIHFFYYIFAVRKLIKNNKIMEFIDIRKNTKCPNCKNDLYNHIWNVDNVLSFSSKYEGYHYNEGFYYYRNIFYI